MFLKAVYCIEHPKPFHSSIWTTAKQGLLIMQMQGLLLLEELVFYANILEVHLCSKDHKCHIFDMLEYIFSIFSLACP